MKFFCAIVGYSREELTGKDVRSLIAPESAQLVADHYRKRRQGLEVPDRYEFMVVRKDGEKRWVEISAAVIEDSQGKKQSIAQMLDITDRKKAELEREQLQNQLRQSQKNGSDRHLGRRHRSRLQ